MRGRPLFGSCGRVFVPNGQFYALTGTLQRSELLSPYYRLYALHLPEGGARSLDVLGNADHLIGRTVHIEGRRWDFAIIDVDRIWAEGDPRPVFLRERLAGWWASACGKFRRLPY